jgi:hypothetical protein
MTDCGPISSRPAPDLFAAVAKGTLRFWGNDTHENRNFAMRSKSNFRKRV